MALVHHATLAPTKLELVEGWFPSRGWGSGRSIVEKVAEYRFDDPDGEVGIETILFRCDDDTVVQVPLTYRAAPLDGADGTLVGTAEHSFLGPRWVYDGCGDPVWARALATAILTGGTQAQMYFEDDGKRIDVPPRMLVRGTGSAGSDVPLIEAVDTEDRDSTTVVRAGGVELVLARVVGTTVTADATLDWLDRDGLTLAGLRPTS